MREFLYNLATDKYKGFCLSLLKFFLLLLSFIYGALIRLLIFFYSSRRRVLKCRVISLGNITLGGTGKTSMVELVSRFLKGKGHKVAILTRGYKKIIGSIGDEPAMLLKNLGDIPVIVDKDRCRAAKRAIEDYAADTVILDDGMQQWGIKKDLEIITINARHAFGNRKMLPRGILREPLSSLRRADIFVLTNSNQDSNLCQIDSFLHKINPTAPIVESVRQPLGFYDIRDKQAVLNNLDTLRGKNAALISGIADPDSFAALIKSLGINIGLDLRYADHHNYTQSELNEVASKAKARDLSIIITTQKDAARLADTNVNLEMFKAHRLLALSSALKVIKNEELFFARLLSLYSI